jgi:DNA-binding winged helix-turn-helix (wHTH) protein/alpha-beta hydrolase superfamily lysophospholipase
MQMTYAFDDYLINASSFEIRNRGQLLNVEPQVFELLLFLIEHRNRILSKDDIIEHVWKGRIVSEAAISSRIKSVRKLIGDDGKKQKYIRTIHGRGFRFIGDIHPPEHGDQGNPGETGDGPQSQKSSETPKTHYAKSGDVHIAYHLFGDGPVNLVMAPGFVSQIDNYWDDPGMNHMLTSLGKIAKCAVFDKRGTGLSDQVAKLPGMDDRMDDVKAVMDAAGFNKSIIMGISEGGSLASLFAASYPERTVGLILYGAFAKFSSWMPDDDALQFFFDYVENYWGSGNSIGYYAPSMVGDEAFKIWWGKFERLGGNPGAVVDLMNMNKEIDISDILPTIKSPTLVVHRTQDTLVDIAGGRYLASHIPGAKLFELPGEDHLAWVGDNKQEIIDGIIKFISSIQEVSSGERVLASVLIIKSCGDINHEHSELINETVCSTIILRSGHLIGWENGIVRSRFSGPASAIHSAVEIVDLLSTQGIDVKAGIHTGEVDISENASGGIAAEIANSVADLADVNEIIVSRTVKDLVAGSGVLFKDAGEYQLPQIDEKWKFYKAIR